MHALVTHASRALHCHCMKTLDHGENLASFASIENQVGCVQDSNASLALHANKYGKRCVMKETHHAMEVGERGEEGYEDASGGGPLLHLPPSLLQVLKQVPAGGELLHHVHVLLVLERNVQADDVLVLEGDVDPDLTLDLVPAGSQGVEMLGQGLWLLKYGNTRGTGQTAGVMTEQSCHSLLNEYFKWRVLENKSFGCDDSGLLPREQGCAREQGGERVTHKQASQQACKPAGKGIDCV